MNLLAFNVVNCRTQEQLEDAVLSVLENPMNNYFVAYSYWNKSCEHLLKFIKDDLHNDDLKRTLYTINIWDIPYYMTIFKDLMRDKNINGYPFLLNYASTPQLLVLNKQSMRVINNNSGIFEELGI
jgi:hypothetical protein